MGQARACPFVARKRKYKFLSQIFMYGVLCTLKTHVRSIRSDGVLDTHTQGKVESQNWSIPSSCRVVSPHPLSSVSALPISRAVWKRQKDLRKCRSFTIIMFNVFRCYLIRGGSSLGLRVFKPSSFSPHTWYFKFGIFPPPQALIRSLKASTVTPLLSLMFYLPVCGYYWRSTTRHRDGYFVLL